MLPSARSEKKYPYCSFFSQCPLSCSSCSWLQLQSRIFYSLFQKSTLCHTIKPLSIHPNVLFTFVMGIQSVSIETIKRGKNVNKVFTMQRFNCMTECEKISQPSTIAQVFRYLNKLSVTFDKTCEPITMIR